MKRQIMIVMLCVAAMVVSVNESKAQIFKLGVKAGLVVDQSKVSVAGINLHETTPGFELGVQTQIKIPVVGLFVQPEFVYSRVSSKIDTPTGNQHLVTSQFDIPVMIGWKFLFMRIQAGPVFSFPSTSFSQFKTDFKNYNTGYVAGLGVDLGRFTIDARYQGEFSKRESDILGGVFPQRISVMNGRFNFSLGYTLFKI